MHEYHDDDEEQSSVVRWLEDFHKTDTFIVTSGSFMFFLYCVQCLFYFSLYKNKRGKILYKGRSDWVTQFSVVRTVGGSSEFCSDSDRPDQKGKLVCTHPVQVGYAALIRPKTNRTIANRPENGKNCEKLSKISELVY